MECVKCGKEMTDDSGMPNIGISININVTGPESRERMNMQKQFGKYDIDKVYQFCWECWLDSLFNT